MRAPATATGTGLSRAALASFAVVLAILAALSLSSIRRPAAELDEGTLLVYPELLGEGKLPYRDYSTLYGPGNTLVLAAVYTITGPSLNAERAVAVGYRLVAVGSLMVLAAPAGLAVAVAAGLIATMILTGVALIAQAIVGAIALALLALALARSGVGLLEADARRAERRLAFAGAAAGYATFLRFELSPVVVLALLPLVLLAPRRGRLAALAGFCVAGVVPWLITAIVVGPARIGDLLSEARVAQKARSLPLPELATAGGSLLSILIVAAAAMLVAGAVAVWMRRDEVEARVALSMGLLGAGLVPYAVSRADYIHIAVSACTVIACLPVALAFAVPRLRGTLPALALCAWVAAVVIMGDSAGTTRAVGDRVGKLVGSSGFDSYRVRSGDRSFLLGDPDIARQMTAVVRRTHALARPGDRLFVGPLDLSTAPYSDTYVYYLLPDLEPASRFVEINPDLANASDSPLAGELRRADWVILSGYVNAGNGAEPNDTYVSKNPKPNRVVAAHFCRRAAAGKIVLLQRCR